MQHRSNIPRNIQVSILLGMLALLTNVVGKLIFAHPSVHLGSIFIYVSAATLGLSGTFTSLALGVVPMSILFGDNAYVISMLILSNICAYILGQFPRVPLFLVSFCIWTGVLFPIYVLLTTSGLIPASASPQVFTLTVHFDTLTAIVSGLLLLNPTLRGLLTQKPYKVTLFEILAHSITIVCAILTLTALLTTLDTTTATLLVKPWQIKPWWGLMLSFLSIAAPSLLAWRLSYLIPSLSPELPSSYLMPKALGFSGLASEFWRRQIPKNEFPSSPNQNINSDPKLLQESTADADGYTKAAYPWALTPPRALCAVSKDGTVLFMNDEFRQLARISHNEPVGKNIASLSMNPQVQLHLQQVIDKSFEKGPRVSEIKLNQLPEKLTFLEFSSELTADAQSPSSQGKPQSIMISVRDVTERRTIEDHLLESQKMGSLKALVCGIGHKLNNLLTTISGQASYALYSKKEADRKSSLSQILQSTQEAGSMIRELLEFNENRPSSMRTENMCDILKKRIDFLKRMVGEGYEISFQSSVKEAVVLCDYHLITQVLTTLVRNAHNAYIAPTGNIWICMDVETIDEAVSNMNPGVLPGKFVRLRVKDQGQGMCPEGIAQAFESNTLEHSTARPRGLGLLTVYAIARAHDGFLTIESHTEKGTSVSFYLPLMETNSIVESKTSYVQPSSSTSKLSEGLKGNREQILVVEDDAMIRQVLTSMLSLLGYSVKSCADGEEALKECGEKSFDLILVDLVMPKMHGIEFVNRLKVKQPSQRTLFMTGQGTGLVEGNETAPLLHKPFDVQTLAQAIKECLSSNAAPSKETASSRIA